MSIISLDDYSSTDRAHLAQLRKTKRDRLHVLELQEARHGSYTEAGVLLEIRDLRAALAALDARLAELAAQPPATTPVPAAIAPVLPAVVVPPAAPQAFANPFTPGVVVPPDRFIGRAYELRTILARLENLLSVSIVGEARIGKSSLLRYLEARLPQLLAEKGRYLAVYISMNEQASQATFAATLLMHLLPHILLPAHEQAMRALEARLDQTPGATLAEAARALGWAEQSGLRVVLLLDEFKDLLERPAEFDTVFRGELRNWYTNRRAAILIATRQPITTIPDLKPYFVNGMLHLMLEVFPPDEAEQLLRQAHNPAFTDEEVRLGLTAGQNHPLRLQAAGFELYRSKSAPPGELHAADGALNEEAPARLARMVQEEYEYARQASQPPRQAPQPSQTSVCGAAAMRTGEAADTASARVMGAFIVLAGLFGLLALIAYVFGVLSLEDVANIWRRLAGGT